MMQNATYTTSNRDFERFLFAHDVFFVNSYRAADGAMVWEYEDTQYLRSILKEWAEILERRRIRKATCGNARPFHANKSAKKVI